MIKIRPYAVIDGVPNMRDSDLGALYEKMVSDGTASTVFYSGDVKSAQEFIALMKRSILIVAYDDSGPVGIGWLNCIENRTARAHFCIFSQAWGNSVEIGKQIVEYAINLKSDSGFLFDMFIGNTPAAYVSAIAWAQKCGAKHLGVLPYGSWIESIGKSCPTAVLYYVRGE